VVSLKSGERFFRESDDRVEIPFGQEYSIFIKNLNSRRVVVKVSIDGKNVLDGQSLVIQPNSVLELEGFMDGNFAKNKFKFIKMTRQIENFRGKTPEDGLLVVEYDFEKECPLTKEIVYIPYYLQPYYYPYYYPNWTYTPTITCGGTTSSSGNISSETTWTNNNAIYTSAINCSFTSPENDGITVKGNDINQRFYSTHVGEMENRPTVISLKMIGISREDSKEKIVFTTDKKVCETCGTNNKNKNKFCYCCGTRI
jgi:hypothetical protein